MKNLKFIPFILCLIFMLQGCSWLHVIQIQNSTDLSWNVEYKLNDLRGVFKDHIIIQGNRKREQNSIDFQSKSIKFTVKPNEIVNIGMARNAHYKAYKEYTEFDDKIPWKPFINVALIKFSDGDNIYAIRAKKLEKVLSKNSRSIARIEIEKVIKDQLQRIP